MRDKEHELLFVAINQRFGTETEGGIQQAEGRLSVRSQGCPGQNVTEKKHVKYRKLNSTTANPRNTPPHTKEDPEGEPQGFFFDHGWTRIPQSGTDKGETRISRIDANSVGDNSRNSCQTLCSLSFPSVIQSCNFAHGRQRFGLRWQSAAATPLSVLPVVSKSGVALRFPPQSKIVVAAQAALGGSVSTRRARARRGRSVVKNLLRPPLQQRGILLEIRDGDTPSLPR